MSLTVKRTGSPPKIDVGKDAARLAARIPGIIRARVAKGLDIFDRPFARYDREYAQLEGTRVDLDAGKPGGLLATLVVVVRITPTGAVIIVKPDAAHAAVGSYLHNGTKHMPARPWLGLSAKDLVVLRRP